MITREKLSRGEGELVEGDPEIGSRKRTSQSEKMASKKDFLKMKESFKELSFHVGDGKSVV
jgi:hypothetical protein